MGRVSQGFSTFSRLRANFWRIRYCDELYSLYKDLNIVRVTKVARNGEWRKTYLAK
jgi:hypothetical protein